MARNYDDYSNGSSDYGSSGSAKLVLAFILLAVLICIGAVLVWSSMKSTSEGTDSGTEKQSTVIKTPVETPVMTESVIIEDTYFEMPEVRSDYAVENLQTEEKPVVYDTSASPAVAVSLSDVTSEASSSVKPVSYTEQYAQYRKQV